MSVFGGQSVTTSILKKSTTLQDRLKSQAANTSRVRFVLPHSQNVGNILRSYLKGKNVKDYESLICLIRDSELLDEDLSSLLKEATECISLMNNNLRLFVDVVLSIRWADRDETLVNEYQSFLVNLLAAHNYHSKVVIDHLVSLFIPAPSEELWQNGIPSDVDCSKCINVHSVLNTLFEIVPMCKDVFLNSIINRYPYFKRGAHINEYYLHNLLWVLDYQPLLRQNILHLIFSKLIVMDVNTPRELIQTTYTEVENVEEIFTLSIASATPTENEVLVETLDVCLNRMFNFILTECHNVETQELNWDKTRDMYKELLMVFDDLVLPTYNCHHVQFCWFVLCGFKPAIVDGFLDFLWKKVIDPSIPAVLRQASIQYIASLLARASYVSLKLLKNMLKQLASWIHSYINTQDGLDSVNSDLRVHTVFYSCCQALFYVTTFRHKEMISSRKNMIFLQNLNLSKIVTSRLNPLKVCQPAVLQNFASFTRNYQLVYCYSIIEHNARNIMPTIYRNERGAVVQTNAILEAHYPFDSFVLKSAGEKIRPFFRNFNEFDINTEETVGEVNETEGTEMDDFLDQQFDSAKYNKFSYGTSPGFKFNL